MTLVDHDHIGCHRDSRVAMCFKPQVESTATFVMEVSALWAMGIQGSLLFLPPCLRWSVFRSQSSASCLQHRVVYRTGCREISNPHRILTTRRAAINVWTAAVCTSDGQRPDDDDYDHHVDHSDACSICWAGLPSIFRSSTVVGTGFSPSHAHCCLVVVSCNLHQSCGHLSGGVDRSQWPVCQIWRTPQPQGCLG